MTLKTLHAIILCCTSLCLSGCATILTTYFPIKVTKTRDGEKIIGEQVGYNYSLTETKDFLVLLREPLCSQRIKRITEERKMVHGDIPALLEIPLLGLGILDLAMAESVSEDSVRVTDAGTVKSSGIIVCGPREPASSIELILEFPQSIFASRIKTDGQGRVSVSAINAINSKDSQYIVFVREKDGVAYVQTVERNNISR